MTAKQRAAKRRKLGLTQEDVARALDVSLSMIRFVETGRRNASKTLAERWADFLAGCEASRGSEAPK